MISIAITGGIACGKSEVAGILAAEGCAVWSADAAAREVLAPGGAARSAFVAEFGDRFFDTDGTLDRESFGKLVFHDRNVRERLNAIVHPPVYSMMHSWLEEQTCADVFAAVIELPLLFETGNTTNWTQTVCVYADRELQEQRLLSRGVPAGLLSGWINAQMPLTDKMRLADVVLINNGSREGLRRQTLRWFAKQVMKEDSYGNTTSG